MAEVLLTGATGFLGQHLLHELVMSGAQVRALSRSAAGDTLMRRLGAQPVRADVTDAASLAAAVDGIEAIFHTAADTNTWRPNNAAQTRTNVGGVQSLLAAAKVAAVPAFMHTSSVSAYSHLVHGILREDVAERGGDSWINYERTKFLAEKAVRESGLKFIIFQPAHILGPGDTRNWSRLIRLVDQNKLPGAPPGSGAFADAREIAKAQVRAWQRGKFGETYLFGGEHASFVALINKMGAQLGRKTPKKATPAFALKAYARLLYAASLITRKMPEITPEAAEFTCHDLQVDSGKAQRELDYRLTDLDTLLADTIAWMREEHMLL
jgi:nucleoside-diphosphate-sugar epimerase